MGYEIFVMQAIAKMPLFKIMHIQKIHPQFDGESAKYTVTIAHTHAHNINGMARSIPLHEMNVREDTLSYKCSFFCFNHSTKMKSSRIKSI